MDTSVRCLGCPAEMDVPEPGVRALCRACRAEVVQLLGVVMPATSLQRRLRELAGPTWYFGGWLDEQAVARVGWHRQRSLEASVVSSPARMSHHAIHAVAYPGCPDCETPLS